MRTVINGELSIDLPEGFEELSAQELRDTYATNFSTMRSFRDDGRHMVVTILWNKSNTLLTKLTSPTGLARRIEKNLAHANKGHDYKSEGLFPTELAGCKAHGVRYSYTIDGVAHAAEAIVFLRGACCYTLYYYTRATLAEANAALRDELYASLSFVEG